MTHVTCDLFTNLTNLTPDDDYIRVTEPLYFLTGLSKVNPEIVRNAAERGTRIHTYCDALIEGVGTPEMQDGDMGYVHSAEPWLIGKRFIEKPPRLFCDELMISGEVDGLYQNEDGSLTLFDLKTSAKESKTWVLQLSAYAYLARKAGYKISRMEVIKLDKEGKKPRIYNYEDDFTMYKICLEIYKRFFKHCEMLMGEDL